MALIVITVRDTDEGDIDVSLEAEPPIPADEGNVDTSKATPAHMVAWGMVAYSAEED